MNCPKCGSTNTVNAFKDVPKELQMSSKLQPIKCRDCGEIFEGFNYEEFHRRGYIHPDISASIDAFSWVHRTVKCPKCGEEFKT